MHSDRCSHVYHRVVSLMLPTQLGLAIDSCYCAERVSRNQGYIDLPTRSPIQWPSAKRLNRWQHSLRSDFNSTKLDCGLNITTQTQNKGFECQLTPAVVHTALFTCLSRRQYGWRHSAGLLIQCPVLAAAWTSRRHGGCMQELYENCSTGFRIFRLSHETSGGRLFENCSSWHGAFRTCTNKPRIQMAVQQTVVLYSQVNQSSSISVSCKFGTLRLADLIRLSLHLKQEP